MMDNLNSGRFIQSVCIGVAAMGVSGWQAAFADEGASNSASVEVLPGRRYQRIMAARIVDLRTERSVELCRSLKGTGFGAFGDESLRDQVVLEFAVVRGGGGKTYESVAEVMSEFSSEPDIQATQAMALAYTKTNPELVDGWLRASRQAYMLPKLNLQYEKENDQGLDYEYTVDENGDLLPQLDSQDADNDDKFVVKLEWRLDHLVMSSEQIRNQRGKDIVKLRDKVLDELHGFILIDVDYELTSCSLEPRQKGQIELNFGFKK